MATSSISDRTDEAEKMSTRNDEEQDSIHQMGWKALFSFTTKKHLPVLFPAFLFTTIAAVILPAMAIVYGLIFRAFADFGAGTISATVFLNKVSKYCIYLTALGSLSWLANSIYFTSFLTFGELQARSARERIFNALLHKDMAWYDTRETGAAAFLPAVQMQIRDLQLSVSQPLGEAVQMVAQTIGALGVALYSSWNLALVVICSVPLVYIAMAFLSNLLSKRAHEQSDQLQIALEYLTNAIRNIEMVKCFNGERFELQRYAGVTAQAGKLYKKQANYRSLQLGVMQFFTLSVFVQGFWYGSYLVISGKRDSGQVVTTFWAALMAIEGITGFLPQLIVLQKGKVAGARLRALIAHIHRASSGMEAHRGQAPQDCAGEIEFQAVSFGYPSRLDQVALSNVWISFPAGETTFVIGRSGSGKSTLGQLLVRLYEPSTGQILLDGVPLPNLDAHWLRDHVTLVEQNSVLFNGSIRQNIALGGKNKTASQKQIEEAISFAMLQQMVQDLPDGLDALLGLHGNGLSGGQRQRMALARARLRDTPVLILDESTSALDYITRSKILQAIRSWRQGKTTIIITHDISQIFSGDFVYVMDKSGVVQQGSRKSMEMEPNSAFHTFLNLHEPDHSDIEQSTTDDTDNIISLYATSWGVPGPPTRPTSGIFFGESLLSPFLSPRRPSIAPSVLPISRKPSIDSEIEKETPVAAKTSPLASGMRAFEETTTLARPRPISTASRRPDSHRLSTLRPLSLAPTTFPTPTTADDIPSFRKTFHAKMERRRSQKATSDTPKNIVETLSITNIIRSVWPRVGRSSRLAWILAILCSLVHSVATPAFGYVFSRLLSTFYTAGNQRQRAQTYALVILGIAVVDGLATYGYSVLFDICAQTWADALKTESMKRILQQSREFFDREENSVSHLAECLDQFGEEARNLPGRFAGILIVIVLTVTIALVWSLIECWKLTLMALASVTVMFCITRIFNATSNRWERFCNEADERIGQVLHETFVNIRTVRCLVLEEVFRTKYKEATLSALRVGIKRSIYTGSIFGLNHATATFISALLFWWGAYIVSKGEFTPTDIIMTFNILMLSVAHANNIGNYVPQINASRDAGSRLFRLARLPRDSHELSGTEQLFSAGDITLENVDFAYPSRKEQTVLQNVTFDIPRGSCIAIVGTSGSGKSTIASLLLKLYQTDKSPSKFSPAICISDHDIKSLHTFTLRSRIAIVAQTPMLFPGTIADNITYGLSPSSSLTRPEHIHAAASAAGVADFIDSLPQGYRTIVGDGGTGLSGGQAQRIAIARALVRNPDILILDEATSALDVESAGIIGDTLRRLVRDRKSDHVPGDISWRVSQAGQRRHMTVIIITHAREMMALAERIVMLDKGRVVEEGTFEELKRQRGPFARLLRGEHSEAPARGLFV